MPSTGPLIFESSPRAMVWGGRALESRLGKPLPDGQSYGEAWEVSDHPRHSSVCLSGSARGKCLRSLMENHVDEIVGAPEAERFPWLLKWLDCHDWLSVQVHPDAEKARTLWPGEGPKNEAWFIIDAGPNAKVWAGLLPGVTAADIRATAAKGTIAECLHSFTPRPGECLYLPAGTVHAVGGGVLMAEIQQTSDATFRLFDWNRVDASGKGRQLHLEESIACIDWRRGPVHPVMPANHGGDGRSTTIEPMVDCPYFQLHHVAGKSPADLPVAGRLGAVFAVSGRGTLRGRTRGEILAAGHTAILPRNAGPWTWEPEGPSSLVLAVDPGRQGA